MIFYLEMKDRALCGDYLGSDEKLLECFLMQASDNNRPIGLAARDIAKGEKIAFDPIRNTKDIIVTCDGPG